MSSKRKNQEAAKEKQEVEVIAEKKPQEKTEHEQIKPGRQEALIYVGPSLPGGLLTKYSTFLNGVPAHIKAFFEQCQGLKQLFIPVSQLSEVELRLKDPTTAESVFYRQIEQYFRKG